MVERKNVLLLTCGIFHLWIFLEAHLTNCINEKGILINQLVWADNVVILAETKEQLHEIITELTL